MAGDETLLWEMKTKGKVKRRQHEARKAVEVTRRRRVKKEDDHLSTDGTLRADT